MKDGIKSIVNGDEFWYNDKGHHRLYNLPAIIYENGDKAFYINGALHRTNGQARVWGNDNKEYYINGIKQNNPEQYTLWICNKVEIT